MIIDHLINAIGSRKIYYLCLLDLSAAFDIIDHNEILSYSLVCPLGLAFMTLLEIDLDHIFPLSVFVSMQ